MSQIQGKCDPRLTEVPLLLQQFIESGQELGASIAVNFDGEEILDIWGGYTDNERTIPWKEDTIVNVWSSTKCATSFAVLKLIDREVLSLDDKVSKHWPEFAADKTGKEDITIRHFLCHTSGVSGWDYPITQEESCDLEEAASRLAKQTPWWPPGSAPGYHSVTFGHLLGKVVREATGGKTVKQIVAEAIAKPLEADFQIGALEKDWHRVADLIPPPGTANADSMPAPDSLTCRTFFNPIPDVDFANSPTWRLAELGASNGHGNARGMARMMSAITLGGTARGKQILSRETADLVFQEQVGGLDVVTRQPVRFGVGYGLRGSPDTIETPVDEWLPPGKICYWGGWGGSMIIMDVDRRLTIAYAMNKMSDAGMGNDAFKAYVAAIYKALGVASPREQL